eukprot:1112968-Pyramimonas_sp.AAC.1
MNSAHRLHDIVVRACVAFFGSSTYVVPYTLHTIETHVQTSGFCGKRRPLARFGAIANVRRAIQPCTSGDLVGDGVAFAP